MKSYPPLSPVRSAFLALLALLVVSFLPAPAKALDYFSIPRGGMGLVIKNETHYPISIQLPIAPGGTYTTIKVKPDQTYEAIIRNWPGMTQMYVTATYKACTTRKWVGIRYDSLNQIYFCSFKIKRVSPGIIAIQ